MVFERYANEKVDPSILGEKLVFRNGREAKNRFLKAPMTELISSWDPIDISKRGFPSDRVINMYEKWGHGGFGAIVTGNVLVDPYNIESAGNIIICKENYSKELGEQLTRWANVMKSDGGLAIMQINHAGRQTPITLHPQPFSASDVQLMDKRRFTGYAKPVPLSLEQIKTEVIDRFVFTAKAAYQAGFDGVEVHAALGYLFNQFMLPTTNLRTDKYGGSVENRFRIVLDTFDAIRKEIPTETGFLIGTKINSAEFQYANGIEEAKIMCRLIEEKGFDFIEMTGGNIDQIGFNGVRKESTRKREDFFFEFNAAVRPMFKKTIVYVAGGFRTVVGMVSAVEKGMTDGIGLGRPSAAEPDLPKKILSGIASSAAALKFSDFTFSIMACNSQMAIMGDRPLCDINNNICFGIPDFSNTAEVENYEKEAMEYIDWMKETAEKNLPIVGVFEYSPI